MTESQFVITGGAGDAEAAAIVAAIQQLLAEQAAAAARPERPNHPAAWVTAHRPAVPPYPSAPPGDVMSTVHFDEDAVGH